MTIEQVSVLFDTGRKGDAKLAASTFEPTSKLDDEELAIDIQDTQKQQHQAVASHVN